MNEAIQQGLTGYSLCPKYKKEEITDERECRNCYKADSARKKIGKLERTLEGLRQGKEYE